MIIKFPSKTPSGKPVEVEHPARIVIVGANGSGKTRLGIWLETNNQGQMPVHRVGAQKALNLPEFAAVKNLEQAEKDLYLGRSDEHASVARKVHDRWGGNPAIHLLSDYNQLLAVLFAKEGERDRNHTQQTRVAQTYVPVPDSAIDQIVKLWSYLMPHRSITFHDGKVTVGKGTTTEYHAKEMSDGERVTLYLLGQCLTAPSGSLIVIDEPELHLHRSLMDKLWNKVEELCPEKSIVYITHDLDFAVSRATARKLWIQAYDGTSWKWSDLPKDENLPESLVLELVGSRKPVIFCEGERGGLDNSVYQLCYPTHHVVPRGSAEKVAESVKALNSNAELHTITASGLIDRDVKTEDELTALAEKRIFAIPFAEVENLICCEQMVRAVAVTLAKDPDEVVLAVKKYVSQSLTEELEVQIVSNAGRRVRYHLSCYSPSSQERAGLKQGVDNLVTSLNLSSLIAEAEALLRGALASGKLDDVLRVYNRKSLADRISTCFGLKHGEYTAFVLRLLKGKDAATHISSLQDYLPKM